MKKGEKWPEDTGLKIRIAKAKTAVGRITKQRNEKLAYLADLEEQLARLRHPSNGGAR